MKEKITVTFPGQLRTSKRGARPFVAGETLDIMAEYMDMPGREVVETDTEISERETRWRITSTPKTRTINEKCQITARGRSDWDIRSVKRMAKRGSRRAGYLLISGIIRSGGRT